MGLESAEVLTFASVEEIPLDLHVPTFKEEVSYVVGYSFKLLSTSFAILLTRLSVDWWTDG